MAMICISSQFAKGRLQSFPHVFPGGNLSGIRLTLAQGCEDTLVSTDRCSCFTVGVELGNLVVEEMLAVALIDLLHSGIPGSLHDRGVETAVGVHQHLPVLEYEAFVMRTKGLDLGNNQVISSFGSEASCHSLKRSANFIDLTDFVCGVITDYISTFDSNNQALGCQQLQGFTHRGARNRQSLCEVRRYQTLVGSNLPLDDLGPQSMVGIAG